MYAHDTSGSLILSRLQTHNVQGGSDKKRNC